jgi:hypothetical protein
MLITIWIVLQELTVASACVHTILCRFQKLLRNSCFPPVQLRAQPTTWWYMCCVRYELPLFRP